MILLYEHVSASTCTKKVQVSATALWWYVVTRGKQVSQKASVSIAQVGIQN